MVAGAAMSREFGAALVAEIPRLRRYARALTGDAARADDLVQDCLERAWSRLHLFRAGSALRPWLFSILHNLHANAARAFSRTPPGVDLDPDTLGGVVAPAHDAQIELDELERALRGLSEEQRAVLLLVGLEQLSYQETAEVLGVPIGTVMSRLSRARERLRGLLGGAEGPRLRRVK